MLVKICKGHELEKVKPNTSEDFFNRSEVVYVENGEEKTLHVLYVRYFDELIGDFTPYQADPLFEAGARNITFKDIVALVSLLANPEFRHRKRVYINTKEELASYLRKVDFEKLTEILSAIEEKQGYELRSPSEIIIQSQ